MTEDDVSILETDKERGTPAFTSAIKILALLEEMAGLAGPIGVSDLARRVGSQRGTVHKRLTTLVDAGFVEQDHNGRYGLSLLAARIGGAALAQAGLGSRLQNMLERLVQETNETATLAAIHGSHALIVQRAESSEVLNVAVRVGTKLPLAYSASALVLQAFAFTAQQRAHLRSSGTELAAEQRILDVCAAGVAVSIDEFVTGLSAVSVPLNDAALNRVVAMTIVGPASRFDADAAHRALLSARESIQTRRPKAAEPIMQKQPSLNVI